MGEEHYAVARGVQKVLQRYKELQDIIAILGMDELSETDKLTVGRARRINVSFRSRSTWQRCLPDELRVRASHPNYSRLQSYFRRQARRSSRTSFLYGRNVGTSRKKPLKK